MLLRFAIVAVFAISVVSTAEPSGKGRWNWKSWLLDFNFSFQISAFSLFNVVTFKNVDCVSTSTSSSSGARNGTCYTSEGNIALNKTFSKKLIFLAYLITIILVPFEFKWVNYSRRNKKFEIGDVFSWKWQFFDFQRLPAHRIIDQFERKMYQKKLF